MDSTVGKLDFHSLKFVTAFRTEPYSHHILKNKNKKGCTLNSTVGKLDFHSLKIVAALRTRPYSRHVLKNKIKK
jgi:hypothetical protein